MREFLAKIFNKNLVKYLGIGYASTILNMVTNILLIKYLHSSELGKISLGKSIFQSFEYSHFGLRFGLDRVLPHLKDNLHKSKYFTAVYIFSILTSSIFILFWCIYDFNNLIFYLFFSVSGLFYTLITVTKIYFRSFDDKTNFIYLSFWTQLFPIATQFAGFMVWGSSGFIVAHISAYIFVFLISKYTHRIELVKLNGQLLKLLKELFSFGGLLFWSSIINFLSTTGDRFFIAKFLGLEKVGEFTVVMFFFTALNMFSVSYTELIMNRIMLNPTFKYIIKQLGMVVIVCLLLVLISYPTLPFFINMFIPKYANLTDSIRMILLSAIPYACVPILNNYLHAVDRRKLLLIVNIVSTSIYFIGLFLLMGSFDDIRMLVMWKLTSIVVLTAITFGAFIYYTKKESRLT